MTQLLLNDPNLETQNGSPPGGVRRQAFLGTVFDEIDFEQVLAAIELARGEAGFRYVVTPNVDHVVRLSREPKYRPYYEKAWLSVCDSMPIKLAARFTGLDLPRVTGSDLTVQLFKRLIRAGDRLTLIAPNMAVVSALRAQFPTLSIRAYVPPPGVLDNAAELDRCVRFGVEEPTDFVFLAIGSPQSEAIAFKIAQEPGASGSCFCIGAALEFVTGMKQRAPEWMSNSGLEWLHRLVSDPKRLWRRYVLSIIPFARLVAKELMTKERLGRPSGR
jgi:N-acetylglucosaminyldiphosphoundecaprenol N-acetyl-beta-D-mannosaminyltransferase